MNQKKNQRCGGGIEVSVIRRGRCSLKLGGKKIFLKEQLGAISWKEENSLFERGEGKDTSPSANWVRKRAPVTQLQLLVGRRMYRRTGGRCRWEFLDVNESGETRERNIRSVVGE